MMRTAQLISGTAPQLKALRGEPLPSWEVERLEARCCIVCSSPRHDPVCYRPDRLLVARCSECGCLYLPLVPDDEQLRRYYDSYSQTKPYLREQGAAPGISLGRRVLRSSVAAFKGIFGSSLTDLVKSRLPAPVTETCELLVRTGGVEGKTIVELGPGGSGGVLPELIRWGARGIAVEVDQSAIPRIRALGIDVHPRISELAGPVDVVYAGMVLEHLKNPAAVLTEVAEKMKPGGRILLRVPNAGQAESMGSNWIGFRVDLEHLNYLSATALGALLCRAGFQTECVWLSSQPVLPDYFTMADRQAFTRYARSRFNRAIPARPDALFAAGDFMLTILARREE